MEKKSIGYWWSNKDIPIIRTEGKLIALNGWNGEAWVDCWEVTDFSDGAGWEAGQSYCYSEKDGLYI